MKSNSFFLFGARGTGKSTFLQQYFADTPTLWLNLLDPLVEDPLARHPEGLAAQLQAQAGKVQWVVLDEIQKVPRLLDVVHQLIESTSIKFALTGSSARKLKRGAANLLAGRAFVNHLFPLTQVEMGEAFVLEDALQWGTLPKVVLLTEGIERAEFLKTYALTYLKEEIWSEHIVRKLDPFRKFLEVAAQSNGDIINYTNIARDVGADTKTVQSYFQILEDTLVGTLLPAYHKSIRKQQHQAPKFYFFDTGVKRALDNTLTVALAPNTYAFGKAFEHWVVIEAARLNDYYRKDFQFYYLRTKDDAEIDLVIERPGQKTALVEIKSTTRVDERDTRTVEAFLKDVRNAEGFCLSRDPVAKKINGVHCLDWQTGLRELGL